MSLKNLLFAQIQVLDLHIYSPFILNRKPAHAKSFNDAKSIPTIADLPSRLTAFLSIFFLTSLYDAFNIFSHEVTVSSSLL